VIFALYALTGWLPNLPLSLSEAISLDRARFQGLVQEMLFSGVAPIDRENIPGPMPIENYNETESTETNIMKTKKAFKLEYDARKDMYMKAISARDDRENKIESIEKHLKSAYDEAYVINYSEYDELSDCYHHHTLPILGVSLPPIPIDKDFDCLSPRSIDLDNISFLVDWRIQRPVAIDESSPEYAYNEEEMTKIHFPKLKPMIELEMKWMTIAELVEKNAHLFSLETLSRVPLSGQIGWHWNPIAKAVDTKKTTKDKPNSRSIEAVNPDSVCSDPGNMPFVVLALDTASFFDADDVSEETVIVKPKSSHLSLCVSIHGDMMASLPSDTEDVDIQPGSRKPSLVAPQGAIDAQLDWSLRDDIVVVLQELRDDEEEPLVMRLELPSKAVLPITRATFHIPSDRLPHPSSSNDGKFIFWIRFLSKSSSYLTFRSSVALTIGEGADIYQRMNSQPASKRHVITKEGMLTSNTRAGFEKILFRMPLRLNSSTPSILEDESHQEPSPVEDTHITVFLHVSNPIIAKFISLVVLYPDSDRESYSLPRLNGDSFILPGGQLSNSSCILLARVFADVNIPPFKWNLSLVSSNPLVDVSSLPKIAGAPGHLGNGSRSVTLAKGSSISAAGHTNGGSSDCKVFSGCYAPNNKLCIFRDVYSVEQTSFPFAFKLSLSKLDDESSGHCLFENVAITVNLYRKQDRQLIESFQGLSIIQAYNIEAAAYQSIKKADTAPSAHGNHSSKALALEAMEIIAECVVDEHHMIVPDNWRASIPYSFQTAGESSSQELFAWRMEILSGEVVGVSHDFYDLERYTAIKNSWEEQNPGRSEQAKAILDAYQMRKALKANPSVLSPRNVPSSPKGATSPKARSASVMSTSSTAGKGRASILKDAAIPVTSYDNYYDLIATALSIDKSLAQKRYGIIESLPEVRLRRQTFTYSNL
jgi:hypothetical protein